MSSILSTSARTQLAAAPLEGCFICAAGTANRAKARLCVGSHDPSSACTRGARHAAAASAAPERCADEGAPGEQGVAARLQEDEAPQPRALHPAGGDVEGALAEHDAELTQQIQELGPALLEVQLRQAHLRRRAAGWGLGAAEWGAGGQRRERRAISAWRTALCIL